MSIKTVIRYVVVSSLTALSASVALAAEGGIDVSSVTSAITSAAGAIGIVGAAVLVMYVGGKVYKWIRAAM